jgi:excisionase family DNA binding protein
MQSPNRKEVDVARNAATRTQEPLLTIPGTAEKLECSEMHIYRLIAAGELRAVDIATPGSGRSKTRVRSDDLADYIERQTRTA